MTEQDAKAEQVESLLTNIVCLQELRAPDEKFPVEAIREADIPLDTLGKSHKTDEL